MYHVKLYNKISKVGLDDLDPAKYAYGEEMAEYDAVLVRSAKLHDVQFPESLKCIARAGAGVNNIPVERCASEGIVVFNTPGANANAVKELVICALLLASRKIVQGANWVKSLKGTPDIGPAAEKGKATYAGPEIAGKRLGIIGLGAIGVKVANAAVGLDMDVWGYDPYLSVDGALKLSRSVKHVTDIKEIFANCDYITIHVPLMDSTKGMINKAAIDEMKDGVVLLNYARDLLVDEDAVLEALKAGKMKKYVTDFANPKVVGAEGTIVTPHLGASTKESEDNCAVMAVKEIRDFLENGNIRNSVNFPNCSMGVCTGAGRVTICHKNIPGMLGAFTTVMGNAGVNISDMTNKGKGDYAYTMMDLESEATEEMVKALEAVDGVLKVRIIQ